MDLATLRIWLSEAEAALHTLLTTGSTNFVKHGDKQWGNGKMSVADLRAYIADLRGRIAQLTGQPIYGARGRSRVVLF